MIKIFLFALSALLFLACSGQKPEVEMPNEVETSSEQVDEKLDTMSETTQQTHSMNDDMSTSSESMNSNDASLQIVYFKFDKFDLDEHNMNMVSENSEMLLKNTNTNIKLEGNCDEWGSDEYNYALGLKRAKSVKSTLISNGIDSSRISIVSYGESNAMCDEKTQSCWSKNRRVETKFLP